MLRSIRRPGTTVFVDSVLQLNLYVDDQLTGNRAIPEAQADMVEADDIAANGGYSCITKIFSGDNQPEMKVLGLL